MAQASRERAEVPTTAKTGNAGTHSFIIAIVGWTSGASLSMERHSMNDRHNSEMCLVWKNLTRALALLTQRMSPAYCSLLQCLMHIRISCFSESAVQLQRASLICFLSDWAGELEKILSASLEHNHRPCNAWKVSLFPVVQSKDPKGKSQPKASFLLGNKAGACGCKKASSWLCSTQQNVCWFQCIYYH